MFRTTLSAVVALSALVTIGVSTPALAQDKYPSKPLQFVCSFPAGSGADIMVRFCADKFGRKIGQTIVVENKPGAGGVLALTYTARSEPDCYTILVGGGNAVRSHCGRQTRRAA